MLGLDRVVIVHPSPYGTDNACTVDALRRIGRRARGVAVIDPLDRPSRAARHAQGGGARRARQSRHRRRRRPSGRMASAAGDEPAGRVAWLARAGLCEPARHRRAARPPADAADPLVVDHFGGARAEAGAIQDGFAALLSLVRAGRTYVKLSGGYRVSKLPDWSDVAPLARALIETNGARMIWGTDWPHPGGGHRGPADRDSIEPFQVDRRRRRAQPPGAVGRRPAHAPPDPGRQPRAPLRLLNLPRPSTNSAAAAQDPSRSPRYRGNLFASSRKPASEVARS